MAAHRRCLLVVLWSAGLGIAGSRADEPAWERAVGIVRDAATGEPLSDMVLVPHHGEVFHRDRIATSDHRGRFEFEHRPGKLSEVAGSLWSVQARNEVWRIVKRDAESKDTPADLLLRCGEFVIATRVRRDGENLLEVRTRRYVTFTAKLLAPTDGRPLSQREIAVVPQRGMGDGNFPSRVSKTDSQGSFRLVLPPVPDRLLVTAPDVGFAVLDVAGTASEESAGEPRKLIPFGSLAGRFEGLPNEPHDIRLDCPCGESKLVRIQREIRSGVPVGTFAFDDVIPGPCRLVLRKPDSKQPVAEYPFHVRPGTRHEPAFVWREPAGKPEPLLPQAAVARPLPDAPRQLPRSTFVTGRVSNARGGPLPGCRVIVSVQFAGNLRMLESTFETRTDPVGVYRVEQVPWGNVVATALPNDKPLTMSHPRLVGVDPDAEVFEPHHFEGDIVVPDQGGAVVVQVLEQQRAVAGAWVRLRIHDWSTRAGFGWALAGSRETALRDECRQFTVRTDETGTARFEHLPSGPYAVFATSGNRESLEPFANGHVTQSSTAKFGKSETAVDVGRTRHVTLPIRQPWRSVRVRLLLPDGRPAASRTVEIELHEVASGHRHSLKRESDADGQFTVETSSSGLWRMSFFLAPATESRNVPDARCRAKVCVAVSALVPGERWPDVQLTEVVSEPRDVIRFRTRDHEGRPTPAYLIVARSADSVVPSAIGVTNEQGEWTVRDKDVIESRHVCVYFPGREWPDVLTTSTTDEVLRSSVPPFLATVTIRPHEACELREQRAGYVRGRVTFPDGLRPDDHALQVPKQRGDEQGDFDPRTGDFILGPLPPGYARITWRHRGASPSSDDANATLHLDTLVVGGDVRRIETTLKPESRFESHRSSWRGLTGHVWLPDGKTPARGAIVVADADPAVVPRSRSWTDAQGRFAMTVPPFTEFVTAWMPGVTAKANVPVPADGAQPLRVVLSRGVEIRGRVTVAGLAPNSPSVPLRVRFCPQGPVGLDASRSETTTADVDGTFELTHMSPGRYTYQVLLDDVWLSPSRDVEITTDRHDLELAMSSPGGSARLRFIGADGSAWRHAQVEVDWPRGPWTDVLRTQPLRTDGAGRLPLDGALAGKARVRLTGTTTWFDVVIPALDGPAPPEQTLHVPSGA